MNWTEGSLSRHSRNSRRNQLLAKQKQHFAKARNKTLNSHLKQSPISISFLDSRHTRSSAHRESPTRSLLNQPSSPLLLHKQRCLRKSNDHGSASSSVNQDKRKRLLDQSDWAGLSFQQPIEISFPGEIHVAGDSRWSKIDHSQSRSPMKINAYAKAVEIHQAEPVQHVAKRAMKIHIGSQEIQPSIGSSSSPPNIRRYSLAPRPLANSAQDRRGQISSPVPSHARRLYVAPVNSKSLHTSKYNSQIQSSTCNRPPLHGPTMTTRPETPAHVVYSSSIIHEPIPRRADDFMVLQWSPAKSEDRGSLQVEIERPTRPALESTTHQSWKNWAANLSDNSSHSRADNSSASVIPLIGSDVSLPSHLQVKLPFFEMSSEADRSAAHTSPEQTTIEKGRTPYLSNDPGRVQCIQEKTSQDNSTAADDLNAEWMKFVFNDNEESGTDVFMEAAHQAALELRPSNTSNSSAVEIETVATCGTDLLLAESEQDGKLPSTLSCDSNMATQGTIVSESVTSGMKTAGSSEKENSGHTFRFAQPKTFVGKFADELGRRPMAPPLASTHGLGGKGKRKGRNSRKKRILEDRTDIRGLPDFDGDPIEEFDED
ncbi:hypothetical protein F5X99DRAFT_353395 [Biscogniauxia marginata]|nr:hypothetical protein F5X99DRAFT_353395 [Biscogniauxia marginata]